MKKNLILLVLCFIIGGYTYYSQEYQVEVKEKQSQLPKLEYGELKALATKNVYLEVKDGYYWLKKFDTPADPFIAKQVLELINNLRVERELANSEVAKVGEDFFFPENDFLTLHFEKNVVQLIIGNKLSYGRSFYGAISIDGEKKYYILKDKAPLVGMYSEEDYKKSNEHYLKIVGLLHLDALFFLPQTHAVFLKGVSKIEVRSTIGRPYTINMAKMNIAPKVFQDVKVDQKQIQKYINALAKIKIKNAKVVKSEEGKGIFQEQQNFENLKGVVNLHYKNGDQSQLKYFASGDEVEVWNDRWPFAQKYEKKNFAFFLPHHQDFYIKSPFTASQMKNFSSAKKIKQENSNKLITYLSRKANWLTKIDKIDTELLKDKLLLFKIGTKAYTLFKQDNDLVLVDDEQKIKYHYYKGAYQMPSLEN